MINVKQMTDEEFNRHLADITRPVVDSILEGIQLAVSWKEQCECIISFIHRTGESEWFKSEMIKTIEQMSDIAHKANPSPLPYEEWKSQQEVAK